MGLRMNDEPDKYYVYVIDLDKKVLDKEKK